MSITKVRPFFRKILDELDFVEHKDAFNFNNIASSNIDRGYHLTSGPIIPKKQNMILVEMEMETNVRLFFKGYSDPASMLDEVIEAEELVIKKALEVNCNALNEIKYTTLISSNREPFGDSNDNIIVSILNFNSLVMVQPD